MTDIHDRRPDHVLMEFTADTELAARIRERLPKHPRKWLPHDPDAERAIAETERAVREELGIRDD